MGGTYGWDRGGKGGRVLKGMLGCRAGKACTLPVPHSDAPGPPHPQDDLCLECKTIVPILISMAKESMFQVRPLSNQHSRARVGKSRSGLQDWGKAQRPGGPGNWPGHKSFLEGSRPGASH